MSNKMHLVIGGAASGKSKFAENLVFQTDLPRIYIATAQAFDDEMRQKIVAHQEMRGPEWITKEAPIDLARAISECPEDHIVLVDCLTMWLSNLMLADYDLEAETRTLVQTCTARNGPVVLVTNEVGHGIVPDNSLARKFRNAQGRLNQDIAQMCDRVTLVVAGLPMNLKGSA